MNTKHFITLFVAILFSLSAYADTKKTTSLQTLSAWTNQSGSTLYIDNIGSDGLLTGTYINRAEGYNCQNISYPVTGWVFGSAVSFSTKWQSTTESCNSITSWTGIYYNGEISTLWQLTREGSSSTSQILQGSDIFTPSGSILNKTLIIGK